MRRTHRRHLRRLVPLAILWCLPAIAQDLEAGFASPPDNCRPWVYWFWLNGNITREGITADLEAMARVGIGGVLIMEVDQGTPAGPVAFASDTWRELFRHALHEAHRLGLQVNLNNDAGWCGSGGPWIRPDEAMQKLVWTETRLRGPARFEGVLPQPETVADYCRDVAVVAFPTPAEYTIPDIDAKSALVRRDLPRASQYDALPPEQTIPRDRIVYLTEHLGPYGRLSWDVPEGDWTVLRFSHTPTGSQNAPSPASGRGLECDKLSTTGAEAHFYRFLQRLIFESLHLSQSTFVAAHIDSWETGSQNWTQSFPEEFRRRRRYDIRPFLPVMTGRVVESLEVSERFLWDLRQTVSELLVENYAGHFRDLCRQSGLRLSIEAYGDTTCDNLAYAGRADEPMGEFWASPSFGAAETLTQMVSAAHTYGRRIVGAEAFTAGDGERWLYHPGSIKPLGDWAFCRGINRFVVHRYALQPWPEPRGGGMSMGPWGLHYERNQTWWERSGPWHLYLTRCQYLLQQGLPVVDLLYLAPEGAPSAFVPPSSVQRSGYKADACSPEAAFARLDYNDGRLVLPDGMSYRALVLPNTSTMTPQLLRRLGRLAEAGATIIGAPPGATPGLTDYPECDEELRALADAIWAAGGVLRDKDPVEVLKQAGVAPDFSADRGLDFCHRRIDKTDVYFVANPQAFSVNATCTFRIGDRPPELWYPETGAMERAAVYVQDEHTTTLPLRLEAGDSVFVVFGPRSDDPDDPVVRILRDDKDLWPPETAGAAITILSAAWGPEGDEARTKDVTQQLQRMVDRGANAVTVAELAAEGDPAYGVVKTLTVHYEVDGQAHVASATDPERIVLSIPSDAAPALLLRRTKEAGLFAQASEAGSYRVVTRSGKSMALEAAASEVLDLPGPWELTFPPDAGTPESVPLPTLVPWNEQEDEAVRHFSGTAVYRSSFVPPDELLAESRRVILDLGRVDVIARVRLNEQDLGILWRAPHRVDVTAALRAGENALAIEVTNLWPNRMIGDERLPEDSDRNPNGTLTKWPQWLLEGKPSPSGRHTFTSWRLWAGDAPLQPSGLAGPVVLRTQRVTQVEP